MNYINYNPTCKNIKRDTNCKRIVQLKDTLIQIEMISFIVQKGHWWIFGKFSGGWFLQLCGYCIWQKVLISKVIFNMV